MDRDCFRAVQLLEGKDVPLVGPELSHTGWTIGPAYYFLLAIPLAISRNPLSAVFFVALLNVLAIILCYKFTKDFFNRKTALIATALYAVFPFHVLYSRIMWNPTPTFFFNILFFYSVFSIFIKQKSKHLIFATLWLFILMQHHFSYAMFIPLLIILFIIFRPKIKRKHILIAMLLAIFISLPYIYFECQNNFITTKSVLSPKFSISTAEQRAGNVINFGGLIQGLNQTFIASPAIFTEFNKVGYILEYLFGINKFIDFAIYFSFLELLLFLGGVVYLTTKLFFLLKLHKTKLCLVSDTAGKYTILLLWFFLPALILSGYKLYSYVGISGFYILPRYLFLVYPSQFIIIAIVLVKLFEKISQIKNGFYKKLLNAAIYVLAIILIGSQIFFSLFYIDRVKKTGRIIVYNSLSLREKLKIVDILTKHFGMNKRTFYNNVFAKELFAGDDNFTYLFQYALDKNKKYISDDKKYDKDIYYMLLPGQGQRNLKPFFPAVTIPDINFSFKEDDAILGSIEAKTFDIVKFRRKESPFVINNFFNFIYMLDDYYSNINEENVKGHFEALNSLIKGEFEEFIPGIYKKLINHPRLRMEDF